MVSQYPRIVASGVAFPGFCTTQEHALDALCGLAFGPDWSEQREASAGIKRMTRLFAAAGVSNRQFVVDPGTYYSQPPTIEDRMIAYEQCSYPLARQALAECLAGLGNEAAEGITDFIVVSCTGYVAPGLDILLARDLGMPSRVRRVSIGHMGCYGALVGLREGLVTIQARKSAVVALLCVELCSLHWSATTDVAAVTSFSLFGDAASAVILASDGFESGPNLVDSYCVSDFDAVEQMSWRITDGGFLMGLSHRVPVTLGRNVGPAMAELLSPTACR